MLKFNKKLAAITVAGAVACSSMYAAAPSNYGVPVQTGKWQLIGVTGLHQEKTANTTTGTTSSASLTSIDMGTTDLGLIDINDNANMVTWDANSSIGNKATGSDINAYTAANNGTGNIFTETGSAWTASGDEVVTYENNGTTYGTADYSILGVQALNHSDTTLTAVAVAINYDRTVNYKNYNSPMRVMYLKSDKVTSTSGSDPDVKIIYQASMEGQMFKLQFTDDTTVSAGSAVTVSNFDFAQPTSGSGDRTGTDPIYYGYFSQGYTYDTPAVAGSDFPTLDEYVAGSSGGSSSLYTYTGYGSIPNVFDMNLTNNSTVCPTTGGSAYAPNYFDPTDSDYYGTSQSDCVQLLEGNLTVYEWDNTDTTDSWKQGWYYRSTRSTVSSDSFNTITNDSLQEGKGYWVKFDKYEAGSLVTNYGFTTSSTPSLPGFLVSNAITRDSYDSSLVKPGWNLVAFEDENIRYSTTGFAVSSGLIERGNVYVNTPNFEKRITIAAGTAPEAACQSFNGAIESYNEKIGINVVNIRCYPGTGDFNNDGDMDDDAEDAGIILIGDRVFSIDVDADSNDQTDNNISTLAGAALDAVYDGNVTLSTGKMTGTITEGDGLRYTSRYGEYALGATLNAHMFENDGNANLYNRGKVGIRIPSYDTVAGEDAVMDVNLTVNMNYFSGNADVERWNEFAEVQGSHSNTYGLDDVGTSGARFQNAMLPVPYGVDIYPTLSSTVQSLGYSTSDYGSAKATMWNIAVDGKTTDAGSATLAAPGLHDGNETVLIAANKRFYIRDTSSVRVFTVSSQAMHYQWGVSIDDGTAKGTNLNLFTVHDVNQTIYSGWHDEHNCSAISDNLFNTANGFTVVPYCVDYNASLGSGTDQNTTVMFISDGSTTDRYFDIREANESLKDGTVTSVVYNNSGTITYPYLDEITEVEASTVYQADGNVTYGAVAHAFTGSKLASMYVDDTDNVTTGIKYVNSASTSVSADNSVEDLTYTPLYTEDFPIDGPLYYLTQISDGSGGYLKPEVFMTAVTANDSGQSAIDSDVITWKAVDVTRDPAEWFDDANNFDLFQTDAGKGYWVYATAGGSAPDTIVTVTTGTPTLTSYVHFNNLDSGDGTTDNYAQTINHVKGTASTTVTGLWRSNSEAWGQYTSGSSFNVIAGIGGYDSRMTPTAAITSSGTGTFTIDLNDYDTAGIDFTTVSTTEPEMNVTAVDGIGGRDSETTTLNYIKPGRPVITNSGLDQTVTSAQANYLYLYEGNISDINFDSSEYYKVEKAMSGGSSSFVTYSLLDSVFLTAFPFPTTTVAAPSTSLDKDDWSPSYTIPKTDLRYVTATDDITNYGTSEVYFSDQYQGAYVPVYAKTHVLEVDTAGEIDQDPMRYGLGTAAVTGIDGGIALEGVGSATVTMSYYPMLLETDADSSGTIDATDVSTLTPDGLLAGQGTYTMHVGDLNDNLIAKITYNTAYVGKFFYIYTVDGTATQLYWGVFPDFGNTSGLSTTTESNPFQIVKFGSTVTQTISK